MCFSSGSKNIEEVPAGQVRYGGDVSRSATQKVSFRQGRAVGEAGVGQRRAAGLDAEYKKLQKSYGFM